MMLRWWQLAIRNWRARFARTLLESVAVVIACALVVLLTCGLAAAERTFWTWHARWIGAADVRITSARGRWIDEAILARVAAVEGVDRVAGLLRDQALLVGPGGSASVYLHGRQAAGFELQPLALHDGRLPAAGPGREIVLETGTAEELGVALGGTLHAHIYGRREPLTVVGLVDRPPMVALLARSAYTSLATAQTIINRPGRLETIAVTFDGGVRPATQRQRLTAVLDGGYDLAFAADRDLALNDLRMVRAGLRILCGALLALAALLIFATLAGSLVGRLRDMGVLRCLGASRRQLAALVLIESLPIALWGVVGGVPLGLLGAWGLARARGDLFVDGMVVPAWGLALAVAGSVAATLIGASLPAVAAARLSPLRAYRPRAAAPRRWTVLVLGVLGLVFTAIPLAMACAVEDRWTALAQHTWIGLPLLAAGQFLLAPWLLWLVAHPLGRLLGWLGGLHGGLIVRGVLRGRWRNAALVTAVAMCVGLV
ncbi:MAG: ABC transporter permease, partial [Planctomycetes bacterium]|nr:ABC transporter permease [Planctomycetota bacterium]